MRIICGLGWISLFLLTACGPKESSQLSSAQKEKRSTEIHDALVHSLRLQFPSDEGRVWSDQTIDLQPNWIIQSPEGLFGKTAAELPLSLDCDLKDSRCDKDFLRLSCETDADCSGLGHCEAASATVTFPGEPAKNLCLTHADHVWNRVYDTMIEAENELDFVSLALPTGRFRTAILHAFAYLTHKPALPKVRMLFSGANPALPNVLLSTDKALREFLSELAGITPYADKLPINLAWLSPGPISWNHSKIIVADGDRAISGGHNLWDKDYLSASPVFDISMEYRGEGARATRDFVNELWTHVDARRMSYNAAAGVRFQAFDQAARTAGNIQAISLGRLGSLGSNPSDYALGAMISLAKSSVYIDQQDLYNQVVTPLTRTFVFENMIDAASRGIHFKVVQSNNFPFIGGFGSTDGKKAYKAIIDSLTTRLRILKRLPAAAARKEACATIEYASFRFSSDVNKWPGRGGTIGTHSKLLIIDEAAFYIGSHNLYPANLQEHGMLVTDAKAASELVEQYWSKVWGESSPGRYECPG